MWSLSRLVAIVLVSALALTSQELARARGQGVVSGTMVLCLGGTMMVVPMGPDGQPAGPAHVCPDAVLAIATAPPAAGAPPPAALLVRILSSPAMAAAQPRAVRLVPQARGPPLPV